MSDERDELEAQDAEIARMEAARLREVEELRAENEKLKARIDTLEEERNRCAFCDKPGVIEHREKMYCQYHYDNGAD